MDFRAIAHGFEEHQLEAYLLSSLLWLTGRDESLQKEVQVLGGLKCPLAAEGTK